MITFQTSATLVGFFNLVFSINTPLTACILHQARLTAQASYHFYYLSHPFQITMESGGVIAEAGWSVVGMASQAEESEIMEQLLGTFPSNCEEGDQELPWSIQASSAFYSHCNASSSTYSSTNSDSSGSPTFVVPSEYGGYYLSNSNKALDLNFCTAPMHLHMAQEQVAAQFVDTILNPLYGSSDSSCEDLGDSGVNLLDSIGGSVKRKHLEQGKLDAPTRVSIFLYVL